MIRQLLPGFLFVTFSALAPFASAQNNAVGIATDFENKKIAAIEQYIEANPAAKDLDSAYTILINAYMNLAKNNEVLDILDKRYTIAPKGVKADLATLINEISRLYIEICSQNAQKERGKKFVVQLKADMDSHPEVVQLHDFIDQIAADLFVPQVGETIDLNFTATNGKKIDLAAYKGKVVLIDFWATWCAPCIEEMPNVITAYSQYQDKGFEVIGVSLDQNLAQMEEFIATNEMKWPQYFDGKGWGNDLAGKYGIKSIPSTFLIGKDGKIMAANLHSDELESTIKAALGIK